MAYNPATSPEVNVQVLAPIPTALTLVSNKSQVSPNQEFQLSGILTRTDTGAPIVGAVISYQEYVGGVWTTFTAGITDPSGYYIQIITKSAVGNYRFRTMFEGSALIAGAVSPEVNVALAEPATWQVYVLPVVGVIAAIGVIWYLARRKH